MNRTITNMIRFVMDELLPPIIRDSKWFMWPLYFVAYKGRNVSQLMDLKREIYRYSDADYAALYADLDSVSRNRDTDLNAKCLQEIVDSIDSADQTIIDVGCGSGYLLALLADRFPGRAYTALDLVPPARPLPAGVTFIEAKVDARVLSPLSYDVVACCHVLEHLLDYRSVMQNLVAAARRKVIFVVPKQRPYRYTLDEHINFFLFPEQFAHDVGLSNFRCAVLDGDIFYVGHKS